MGRPGGEDGFLVGVDPDGGLTCSRVFGGSSSDSAGAVSLLADRTVLIVGQTASVDFRRVGASSDRSPGPPFWEMPFVTRTDRLATRLWESLLLPAGVVTDAQGPGSLPCSQFEAVSSDGVFAYTVGRTGIWSRGPEDWTSSRRGVT